MLKKLLVGGVMLALVLTVVGGASAVSAQSMDLCATVDALAAAGIIAPQDVATAKAAAGCGVAAPAASYTFTRNLTLGATGADVTALQNFLISNGNTIPAGATGYFGAQTQAALAAYQAAKGITPAVGYFGPITMASVNANTQVVTPVAGDLCPNGMTLASNCTLPPGGVAVTLCPNGMTLASNCTVAPGATGSASNEEGWFTAKIAGTPSNNANAVAGSDVPVLGIEIEARQSDIKIQRADLEFEVTRSGSVTNPGNFITNISIYDGSRELVSKSVNNSSFERDGSRYYVRMTGIDANVAKGAKKTLTVRIDTVSGLDSNRVVKVSLYNGTSAIRGTDNAGVDSNTGFTESRTHTFKTGNDSTVNLSSSASNPDAKTVAVDDTDGVSDVPMLAVRLKSTVGASVVKDVRIDVGASIATSSATTLSVYEGNTLIDSASVPSTGIVVFEDLDIDLAKDETRTLTFKADFPALARGTSTLTFVTASSTYETPEGTLSAISGSNIQSNVVTLKQYAVDLNFKSANVTPALTSNSTGSTTVMSANIVVELTPVGASMTEPVVTDFVIKAATSTVGTQTTVTNVGFNVNPNNTNNIIPDGTKAVVTLSPTVYNADLPINGPYYFYIESIIWTLDGVSTTQTWALESFKTLSAPFVK